MHRAELSKLAQNREMARVSVGFSSDTTSGGENRKVTSEKEMSEEVKA